MTAGLLMRWALGLLDIGAGMALFWATAKITADFGFRTRRERWALTRRVVQFAMMLALLNLGLKRIEGSYPDPTLGTFWSGAVIASGIIFYPLMRALGWITQDELLDGPTRTNGNGAAVHAKKTGPSPAPGIPSSS